MYDTVSLSICLLPLLWYLIFAVILKVFIHVLEFTKSACELRHVLLFVRLSVSTRISSAPTGRISMKFVIRTLHENTEVLNSVKFKQECGALYIET